MTTPLTLKTAKEISCTLGKTTKMECASYGIPANACKVGGILAKLKGTVCHDCYAMKGNYTFPSVKKAQTKRLASLYHPQWTDAMVRQILHTKEKYFRWFDSGDIQSMAHLINILDVVRQTPDVLHWLPTKETPLMHQYAKEYGISSIPANIIIRISGTKVNGGATKRWPWTSTVHHNADFLGDECEAYTRQGNCGPCRKCWDRDVQNVSYPKH